MENRIKFHVLDRFEEYSQVENVQEESWGFPDREIVPKRILFATSQSGGVVIGAFLDDLMIGYTWCWIAYNNQFRKFIYSHHNAVRKKYQNKNIGFLLKLEQRKWALKNGYKLIKWVFDPLQTKNCNLNLHKLGATCNTYKVNYWLELKDQLNKGVETDRFFCDWNLQSKHADNHINQIYTDYSDIISDSKKQVFETIQISDFIDIEDINMNLKESVISIEVPSNFIEMKRTNKKLAIEWRLQTRAAFQNYFNLNYKVIDFIVLKSHDTIRCFHILEV